MQCPPVAQSSPVHLSNAAAGNWLCLKTLKQVRHPGTKSPPDGCLSEVQRVYWGLCVQLGQLLAEVWRKHVPPGCRPLTPFDECWA